MTNKYRIEPFATRNGKAQACDVFTCPADSKRWTLLATARKFVTYPASVRARTEAEGIINRHKAYLTKVAAAR